MSSATKVISAAALYAQDEDLTPTDRERLVIFLSSDTGKFVLGKLKALAPDLRSTKGLTGEQIIAESLREKGYYECLDALISLVESKEAPAAQQPPTAYPDIDDDSLFNEDGTPKVLPSHP